MIVFTKDTQYNQCKREDILNFQNQKYINSLKHELKTGKGLINTALRYMPEMHLSLPNTVESENIPNGSFQNTGKYSYCGPGTKVKKRVSEGYQGVNKLDNACKEHDIYYSKYKNTQARNVADDILASKGAFRLCYKNCSNLGCMQEIARKNCQTFYTTHPTPNF